jgi:hypothetical protein
MQMVVSPFYQLLGMRPLNCILFVQTFGHDRDMTNACQNVHNVQVYLPLNVYNVQVYLRLAAVDFAVESVPTRAGAEQIPALEDGDEVVMANESGGIQAYLREHKVGCLFIPTASMPKRG